MSNGGVNGEIVTSLDVRLVAVVLCIDPSAWKDKTGFHVLKSEDCFSTLSRGMEGLRAAVVRPMEGGRAPAIYKVVNAMSYQRIGTQPGGDRLAIGLVYYNRRAISTRTARPTGECNVRSPWQALTSCDPRDEIYSTQILNARVAFFTAMIPRHDF